MAHNLSFLAVGNPAPALAGKRSGGFDCQPGSRTSADPVGLAAPVLLAFFFHLEELLDRGQSRLDNKSGCVEVSEGSPTVGRKHGLKTPGEIESQFEILKFSKLGSSLTFISDVFKLCDTECFLYLQNVYQTHSGCTIDVRSEWTNVQGVSQKL